MRTSFSEERMALTKRAHLAAQSQFYAPMFGGAQVTFEDTVSTVKDLDYAVDCIAAVTVSGLRAPLRFAIQERWREPAAMRFGDVTVTEWNLASGQPSELHKFGAHLFVYGFYDDRTDRILAGAAVDVSVVLHALVLGELPYKRESRVDQTFLGFSLRTLRAMHAVIFDIDNRATES